MIVQLSVAILANCVLEIDHRVYSNQVEWKEVLSHWLSNGNEGIQMHTKFLCSLLAPAIDHDTHNLFRMSQTEINAIVGLLGTASNSPALTAAAWDMQFSALELVKNMIYLCFYAPNLTAFANTELMPTIISLLVHQNLSLSKAVIQLVWILLEDSGFKSHSEPFMDDVIDICSAYSMGDYELQFLTFLLQFALTSPGEYTYVHYFIWFKGFNDFKLGFLKFLLFVCQYVCVSVCLSVCLSICLSVCLSVPVGINN